MTKDEAIAWAKANIPLAFLPLEVEVHGMTFDRSVGFTVARKGEAVALTTEPKEDEEPVVLMTPEGFAQLFKRIRDHRADLAKQGIHLEPWSTPLNPF